MQLIGVLNFVRGYRLSNPSVVAAFRIGYTKQVTDIIVEVDPGTDVVSTIMDLYQLDRPEVEALIANGAACDQD